MQQPSIAISYASNCGSFIIICLCVCMHPSVCDDSVLSVVLCQCIFWILVTVHLGTTD